jgi:hypothetical protein
MLISDGVAGTAGVDPDDTDSFQATLVPCDELDLRLTHTEYIGHELEALRVRPAL